MAVIFLNSNQAKSGRIGSIELPEQYVLACKLFGAGLIDRSRTLDQGFDYSVVDEIPAVPAETPQFGTICDRVASDILDDASRTGQDIRMYWSGGIDSTAALCALLKNQTGRAETARIRVMLSRASIAEYPLFYRDFVRDRCSVRVLRKSVSDSFDPRSINVTGEHGDQLFGSVLMERYCQAETGLLDYDQMFPIMVAERFGNGARSDRLLAYLEPQIQAAPVPLRSFFDCLWWFNYSLKWQQVSLRLQTFCGDRAARVHASVRHFYRDPRFEQWALANGDVRFVTDWQRYKDLAKQYIYAYTRDFAYYDTKKKEKSLKSVIVPQAQRRRYRALVHMCDDFVPVIELREREASDIACS